MEHDLHRRSRRSVRGGSNACFQGVEKGGYLLGKEHANAHMPVQFQVPCRKIRSVVQLPRHLEDAIAGLWADSVPAVEGTIDGSDRYPQRVRKFLNARSYFLFFRHCVAILS
jgi:hypothetical protein